MLEDNQTMSTTHELEILANYTGSFSVRLFEEGYTETLAESIEVDKGVIYVSHGCFTATAEQVSIMVNGQEVSIERSDVKEIISGEGMKLF